MLSKKKTNLITIVPIGIAYSKVSPRFRGKVSLCFGEPLYINNYLGLSIEEFNIMLYARMNAAENKALKDVGR